MSFPKYAQSHHLSEQLLIAIALLALVSAAHVKQRQWAVHAQETVHAHPVYAVILFALWRWVSDAAHCSHACFIVLAGATCQQGDPCLAGTCFKGVCTRGGPLNAKCSSSSACASNICFNGTCQLALGKFWSVLCQQPD